MIARRLLLGVVAGVLASVLTGAPTAAVAAWAHEPAGQILDVRWHSGWRLSFRGTGCLRDGVAGTEVRAGLQGSSLDWPWATSVSPDGTWSMAVDDIRSGLGPGDHLATGNYLTAECRSADPAGSFEYPTVVFTYSGEDDRPPLDEVTRSEGGRVLTVRGSGCLRDGTSGTKAQVHVEGWDIAPWTAPVGSDGTWTLVVDPLVGGEWYATGLPLLASCMFDDPPGSFEYAPGNLAGGPWSPDREPAPLPSTTTTTTGSRPAPAAAARPVEVAPRYTG